MFLLLVKPFIGPVQKQINIKPVILLLNYGNGYFKIGNYTQSNSEKEGIATNDSSNYGEVIIYDYYVNH